MPKDATSAGRTSVRGAIGDWRAHADATVSYRHPPLDLNLLAAFRLDRRLVPQMLAQGAGVVVHVTSIQRQLPLPESTKAYAAAKAALSTYSKSLSKEVSGRGVRVVRVARLGRHRRGSEVCRRSGTRSSKTEAAARDGVVQALAGIPLARPTQPQELAELVPFRARPRSSNHGDGVRDRRRDHAGDVAEAAVGRGCVKTRRHLGHPKIDLSDRPRIDDLYLRKGRGPLARPPEFSHMTMRSPINPARKLDDDEAIH